MNNPILIYTDGSCLGNGKEDSVGGWAFKIINQGECQKRSGYALGVTNNQMEMYAVMRALQFLEDKSPPVIVYSDSQYVVKTLNHEYNISKNQSLWNELKHEVSKFPDIEFRWVKGHDKNEHNIEVDNLAQSASKFGKQCQS